MGNYTRRPDGSPKHNGHTTQHASDVASLDLVRRPRMGGAATDVARWHVEDDDGESRVKMLGVSGQVVSRLRRR